MEELKRLLADAEQAQTLRKQLEIISALIDYMQRQLPDDQAEIVGQIKKALYSGPSRF